MEFVKSKTFWICLIILVLLGVVYFVYEPTATSLYPRCVFLEMTGYRCTGCGMQRAIHSLLHLRFGEAFHYNAYFVIVLPLLVLLFLSWCLRGSFPRLYALLTSQPLLWTLGCTALVWWIGRNIVGI